MSGILNKILTNDTIQHAGTVDGQTFSSVNVSIVNDTNADLEARVWITTSDAPSQVDLVEPKAIIPAYGRYEMSARICSVNEKIFVKAPTGGVVRIETVNEL